MSDRKMDVQTFPRLLIEKVSPTVDDGRYPIKRLVGDRIQVGAAIYKDGHELITARILSRPLGQENFHADPLEYRFEPDHWYGSFEVAQIGNWEMVIEAWPDLFRTWRRDLEKRIEAGQDVRPEFLEGAALVRRRVAMAPERDHEPLLNAARVLSDDKVGEETRRRVAFSKTLLELMYGPLEAAEVERTKVYPVRVDRREAGFAAWYELFPRSQAAEPGRHGTFADTEKRLPEIAAMGFDVIYLPPIHPIGMTHRKGRNNSTTCQAGDVGSPWAIGGEAGGHTAVHPELGTLDDFRKLVKTAGEFGIEVALDFALQCSPDHPWVKEHPEWFFIRPDGSIRYAENPPKKYEDIYPLNFWGEGAQGLWEAARDALFFWAENGVRTFRVDNPHTKPLSFWEWCIREVQAKFPDVVFLSESFTRPNRMQGLAKIGFTQSYTYFTWKNTKEDLIAYLQELSRPPVSEYYRPNFFANTPDILHEYLQHGGRAAFRIRALLAATLAPVYGIYSGFELCENQAVHAGSEEYLDSEKYELKHRDHNGPANIKRDISRLNRIRRSQPALAELTNLRFVQSDNDEVVAYLKLAPTEKAAHLLVVVTTNPHQTQESNVHVPLEEFGLSEDQPYDVHDLLNGATYTWKGSRNYVRFDPKDRVGHLFRIEPR
ncbi:MAG TPA: alpha-1,4-glucan--maltose-1-phosphate maltosyltransferase [Polyangiaceae bacterium]|nr:alpha-1,4-glucan--maltose-1-phosphate maltosyltransferase [Polyangiaceae bacterium]